MTITNWKDACEIWCRDHKRSTCLACKEYYFKISYCKHGDDEILYPTALGFTTRRESARGKDVWSGLLATTYPAHVKIRKKVQLYKRSFFFVGQNVLKYLVKLSAEKLQVRCL